jgi:hypothetical protein
MRRALRSSPLLYRPLVEFMLRVPWGLKTGVSGVRQLLRQATRPWLPDTVRNQSKASAGFNLLRTFARDWKSIEALAEGRMLAEHSFVQPAAFLSACQRLSHGFAPKSEPLGGVWNALVLERWLQLDGPKQGDLARQKYREVRRTALSELARASVRPASPSVAPRRQSGGYFTPE